MQPPIPQGIILNKHYRIVKVLGAGGFGRTYLAEDTSRYDEKCVLKEYNPNLEGTYALEKSKELFEREAEILYKIEHPRIPKFWGTFEQGKRLFLAQGYVEGKTYKTLLGERVKENKQFTPPEVVQFLQQMLPVLEHIHRKGIIHRDISPDNIICRQSDRLPVLIDFGAVKELGATQLRESGKSIAGTNVGKHGYSPPEQLQTGKVYPNSDLYSLAATAVVLMTGRKPEELLNEQSTASWRWHQWVPTLELWLAELLNKMLSPKPDKRYQSATEVAQELRSRAGGLVGTAKAPRKKVSDTSRPRSNSVKHRKLSDSIGPASASAQQNSKKSDRAPTPSLANSILNTSLTAQVIRAAIVVFVAFGTIGLLRSPSQKQLEPVIRDLKVSVGETASARGKIKAHETYRYMISVEPGQVLNLAVDTEGVLIRVLGSDSEPIDQQATEVAQWEGTLEEEGSYYIEIIPASKEEAESEYNLEISLLPEE